MTASPASAGPPYVTDDPEPTEKDRYEIYFFSSGSAAGEGVTTATGIDFNFGAATNLQTTLVVPVAVDAPGHGTTSYGLGNVELAAKYKLLHQSESGIDLAIFPRVFLPTRSAIGSDHASFLLPIWLQRSWERWSAFGGGGCEINRSQGTSNFCTAGLVVTHQLSDRLQLGTEVFHRTPDVVGEKPVTGFDLGLIYDVDRTLHLTASLGTNLPHPEQSGYGNWYVALLTTF